ncbi:YWV1-like protein [Mya arenaria]|uniref:YWV1-like protein n=1 Tax=Mya arenaria TaxID=6604 RepID=A0ABY7FII7_MYAAR|nr:YWV1-like protein [Mya arenaria]
MDKLKICFTNTDTLSNKVAELELFLATEKPHVLGLCEVYPKVSPDKMSINDLKFTDYDVLCPKMSGERGVLLLVHKSMKVTQVYNFDHIEFNENVWCEFELVKGCCVLLGMIYRSPTSSVENDQKLINLINSSVSLKYDQYVLLGDFNYKDIDWKKCESKYSEGASGTKFLDCVQDNFLHQHVLSETRFRHNQAPSCLDLVFTKEDSVINQETITINSPLGCSDHSMISFELDASYVNHNETNERFQYYKGNYEKIREDLSSVNWDNLMEGKSVNEMWIVFRDTLCDSVDKHVPKKKSSIKKCNSPLWLDRNTKLATIKKNKAWKKYKYSRSTTNYNKYAEARNECSREVKSAKRNYEQKIASEVKTNAKSFWRYVNSKRKTKDKIGDLNKSDNTTAVTDEEKSEVLNGFFSSVFQDLDNLCNWSTESKLSFNASKCKVMHIGSNNDCARYTMQDIDGNYVKVESVASEKDLGVIFDSRLTFEEHITEIASKAHRVTGIIWRSFEFMNKDMFLNLYKSIIRPIVEYGSCVWSPYLKKDIKRLEDVQRRATKLVKDVSDLSYEQRLKALGIPTLEYRRDRADMIQIYKSVYGHDELKWDHLFTLSSGDLRGHHLKFFKKKSKHNSRLYSFSQRSIMYWNSLSEETVSAKSINQFKSMLNIEHWNRKKDEDLT